MTGEPAGASTGPAVMGTLAEPLGEAPAALIDRRHGVEIVLPHDGMTLTSADASALDRGANLALIGDAVDNVPGVEKVGPKTAVKWISQYGSLDGVVAHAGEIGGVVGANLRKALDWLPQGRRLLTVKCDVELPFTLGELDPRPRDTARLAALFERCGFRSWLRDVAEGAAPGASPAPAPATSNVLPEAAAPAAFDATRDYECVLDEAALLRWVDRLGSAELVSFDTETTSLDPMHAKLVGMSFCVTLGLAGAAFFAAALPGALPGALGVWAEAPAARGRGRGISRRRDRRW